VSEERKSLYEALADQGMLEYGCFIPGEFVRGHLELEMPELGTRSQFNAIALQEMSAVDGVREILLNQGKYVAGCGSGYRILTPGENKDQVDRYLAHAQNKIRRARKLERTSNPMSSGRPDQTHARLQAIERGIRSDFRFWNKKEKPDDDEDDATV
jgi:hypothetical protein